jgi:hypothetical protein
LNQSLYLVSSPAAVTILNHPNNNITNAISDNSHKAQFIKFFITVINPPSFDVHPTPTISEVSFAPNHDVVSNHCAFTNATLHIPRNPAIPRPNNNFLNIFLFIKNKIVIINIIIFSLNANFFCTFLY